MNPRTEAERLATASMLLLDEKNSIWTKDRLKVVFSLGLTVTGISRCEAYLENNANSLLMFVLKNVRYTRDMFAPASRQADELPIKAAIAAERERCVQLAIICTGMYADQARRDVCSYIAEQIRGPIP